MKDTTWQRAWRIVRGAKDSDRAEPAGNGQGELPPGEYSIDDEPVKRAAREIAALLERYMRAQAEAFPYARLEEALRVAQRIKGARHDALEEKREEGLTVQLAAELDAIIEELAEETHTLVEVILAGALASYALSRFARIFAQWAAQTGQAGSTLPGEGPALEEWAEERAGEMLARIDEGTRRRVGELVSDGLDRPPEEIIGDLREYLEDDDELSGRARMIADDEAIGDLHRAAYLAAKRAGAKTKQWITMRDPNVCDLCKDNEGQGIIPIDNLFSSGHLIPLAHANCRCRCTYPDLVNRNPA